MEQANNEHITVWSVGEPPPIKAARKGESAILVTFSMGLATMVLNLPDVTEEDREAFVSPLYGVGLYQSPEMPVGAISMLLRTSDTHIWTLAAPILDDMDTLSRWARAPMERGILMALVDSNTGLVCRQKIFGLPERLLEMVRAAIASEPPMVRGRVMSEFMKLADHERWNSGTQWRDMDDSGQFTLRREQV